MKRRDHEADVNRRRLRIWMKISFVEGQKEKWQQEFLQIEQRRNDLLPEHDKMQNLLQKFESLQDKKAAVSENARK